MKKLLIILCFGLGLLQINAQENIKTMFYNLLNFPDISPDRIDDLELIITDYQPDLLMVCELNDVFGAGVILTRLQTINPNYAQATFFTNTSDDAFGDFDDLQNLIYYDSSKFILEAQDIVQTTIRDFNRYTLKLNTVNQVANPIRLEVFVGHLKAGNSPEDEIKRFLMAEQLTSYLSTLDANTYVLFAGDLNLYTSNDITFNKLTDPTEHIPLIDPINRLGDWHNNSSFIDVLTQSTRTQSGLGGASGGFDDRFDFILTSGNILTNPDLYYVPNSYKSFGNNLNPSCYNSAINSTDCAPLPGATTIYSQALRNALHDMSDHLPVVMELETNEQLLNTSQFAEAATFNFIRGNVVEDQLSFMLNSTQKNNEYAIYDVLARKLTSGKMNNNDITNVDVSYLPKGIYYLKIKNYTETQKFIKK
ncbi:T9SS type A sorting domain-containing protein [Kordia sp. YSTF-M3]|uniref:T9SS type A sorting domain-containing protein n=1 Tax=Kordia aestuariivivens TaxID=2759037 RepID=A0ABR7Q8I4_9FLAO|nr:T9SS type A sorting domain-containing protein [Kordia aestuariivivens]MBC8754871.1 T9SS type A sorting domain-containing protein [Kordia aestuariivivens]